MPPQDCPRKSEPGNGTTTSTAHEFQGPQIVARAIRRHEKPVIEHATTFAFSAHHFERHRQSSSSLTIPVLFLLSRENWPQVFRVIWLTFGLASHACEGGVFGPSPTAALSQSEN